MLLGRWGRLIDGEFEDFLDKLDGLWIAGDYRVN